MHGSPSVVVVGAGLSGLATALGCALRGLDVTVLEAADEVGGAAAFSGGMVWAGATHVAERAGIGDSPERTIEYVRHIGSEDPACPPDEAAMLHWIATAPAALEYWESVGAVEWEIIPGLADYHAEAPGALPEGRYLTAAPFDAQLLGEWLPRLRVSPYFPVGTSYADMLATGRRQSVVDRAADELPAHAGVPAFGRVGGVGPRAPRLLTFGTGLVAGFLTRAVAEPQIRILLGERVTELTRDDAGAVVGVVAEGPAGRTVHEGTVVLTTSGYDWDDGLVEEFLQVGAAVVGSVAPTSVRGDGLALARSVGAHIDRIPRGVVPMVPGWSLGDGTFGYGPEFALPHSMMVNRAGRRFCDDSYWVDIVDKIMADDAGNLPYFLVWDSQHHAKYGFGDTPPGASYPEGMVTSAPTLAALGEQLGIDPEALVATAAEFSRHALEGDDPAFGRGSVEYILRLSGDRNQLPNNLLGTVEKPPFHGLRLRLVQTGIGMSGIAVDLDGRVVGDDGDPVVGLYAAGSCVSFAATGTGYNSGFALSRCLTHAYTIADVLAGQG